GRWRRKDVFLLPYFVEILKAKGTLKQDVRENIFSSLPHILSVNQSLLLHMENSSFSRGFQLFSSHLHLYVTYVDNIYSAYRVLALQLKNNKAFRHFKKLQESRAEFKGHMLEDLLPLPVQRMEQYERLLQAVSANTSPLSPEFEQLTEAVSAVGVVSLRALKNRRHHENHMQLCRVQKLLKNRRSRVVRAGRWFLKEGSLLVVPIKGSETKLRMFFLFSDVLLQTKRCSRFHLTQADKFSAEHVFPLLHCQVDKVLGHTRSQGGLLSLTFPKAKLLLMSNDQESLNDWYQSLTSATR
uniref:Rho guanine nucleotide exchange factor (GEF) 39 n=1 Tax=Gouania willdenowi TaxID=441366 RepID=A0A8C5E1H2_GOUWI